MQLVIIKFSKIGKMLYLPHEATKPRIFFKNVSQYARNIKLLPMYYLYPLKKLNRCLNLTKIEQKANNPDSFFVSPVQFTKVHVKGFCKRTNDMVIMDVT